MYAFCLKSVVKLPHENVVPTQRDVWKKKTSWAQWQWRNAWLQALLWMLCLGFLSAAVCSAVNACLNASFWEYKYLFPVTKTMFLNCYNMQKMFLTLVIMYVKHVFNLAWRCTFIVLASLLLSQHRRDHVTRNQLTQSTENHLLLSLGGDNDLCLAKTLQAWTILNLINLGSLDIYILKPSL